MFGMGVMERLSAFFGVLGLAAAAGGLAIGNLVILPGLTGEHVLLDANQAISLAGPLHLRCAEFTLVGALLMALAVPRWVKSRGASALALVATGCAAIARLWLLPQLYEAWAKVDLVAARPVARMAEAELLAEQALSLDVLLAAVLVAFVVVVSVRPRRSVAPPQRVAAEPVAKACAPTVLAA